MRKLIAYHLSIVLILIFFGLVKPSFHGETHVSNPIFKNKSSISLDVEEEQNKQNSESTKIYWIAYNINRLRIYRDRDDPIRPESV